VHYLSSGSVGKPKDGDPRAAWVEMVLGTRDEVSARAPLDRAVSSAGNTQVRVGAIVHRVAYDVGGCSPRDHRRRTCHRTLADALLQGVGLRATLAHPPALHLREHEPALLEETRARLDDPRIVERPAPCPRPPQAAASWPSAAR